MGWRSGDRPGVGYRLPNRIHKRRAATSPMCLKCDSCFKSSFDPSRTIDLDQDAAMLVEGNV
jgi:hypothetical protein